MARIRAVAPATRLHGPNRIHKDTKWIPKTTPIGVEVRETLTGYFVPGHVDMGSGLLGFVVVVSCRRVDYDFVSSTQR